MIHDFDDFCLWMYVTVDEIWQRIAWQFRRPGPAPECSDSELITMALVGECRGWDMETEMLCQSREHRDLFPRIPTQSRFNRRRRNLQYGFNVVRQVVLQCLDLAQDHMEGSTRSLAGYVCRLANVTRFRCLPGKRNQLAAGYVLAAYQRNRVPLAPMEA